MDLPVEPAPDRPGKSVPADEMTHRSALQVDEITVDGPLIAIDRQPNHERHVSDPRKMFFANRRRKSSVVARPPTQPSYNLPVIDR